MLAVGVERDDVRGAARARGDDAGAEGLRLAEPARVPAHVGAGGDGRLRGAVGRAVVHDDHRRVQARPADDLTDGRGLVVGGNDDEGDHAAPTTSATWVPPRASPCTRPRPGRTRSTRVVPSVAGSSPDRAVHAAAATRSTPSPA